MEAMQVAIDHGLESELRSCRVSLLWAEEHAEFVWVVGERRLEDVGDLSYLGDSRVFVIGARSADVLEIRKGWEP